MLPLAMSRPCRDLTRSTAALDLLTPCQAHPKMPRGAVQDCWTNGPLLQETLKKRDENLLVISPSEQEATEGSWTSRLQAILLQPGSPGRGQRFWRGRALPSTAPAPGQAQKRVNFALQVVLERCSSWLGGGSSSPGAGPAPCSCSPARGLAWGCPWQSKPQERARSCRAQGASVPWRLLWSRGTALSKTSLNSFQWRKLLSSAGTPAAKQAVSRRRLSPGWREDILEGPSLLLFGL